MILAIDAVTFADQPGKVYLPVREVAKALGWTMEYDPVVGLAKLHGETLDPKLPQLSDGTFLISVADLTRMGAQSQADKVSSGQRVFRFTIGSKRVSVDLKSQVLRAWQGKRLVYQWPVSSGREGKETPNGSFKASGKEKMHISTIYGSPMPYSVHVTGNIYIHGSSGFTTQPGSHGCIRLPLMSTRNVAEEFYGWIDLGVPIQVSGAYAFRNRNPDSK